MKKEMSAIHQRSFAKKSLKILNYAFFLEDVNDT